MSSRKWLFCGIKNVATIWFFCHLCVIWPKLKLENLALREVYFLFVIRKYFPDFKNVVFIMNG